MAQAFVYKWSLNLLVICHLFTGIFAKNISSTAAAMKVANFQTGDEPMSDWMITTIIVAGTVIVFWALCLCVLGICLCTIYYTNRKKLQSNHIWNNTPNPPNNNNNTSNHPNNINNNINNNLQPHLPIPNFSKSEHQTIQTSTNKSRESPLPDPEMEHEHEDSLDIEIINYAIDRDNDNSDTLNVPSYRSLALNNNPSSSSDSVGDGREIADTTMDVNVYPSYNYGANPHSAPATSNNIETAIQFTLNQNQKTTKNYKNTENDGNTEQVHDVNPIIHQLTPSQIIHLREYMFAGESNQTATVTATATATTTGNEASSPQESTTLNTWKIVAQTDGLETGQLTEMINAFEAEQERSLSPSRKATVLPIINSALSVKDGAKTDTTPPIVAITPRNWGGLEPVDDNKEDMIVIVVGENDEYHTMQDGYLDTRFINVEESQDDNINNLKSPTETYTQSHYKLGLRHTIMSDHGKYPSIPRLPSAVVIYRRSNGSNVIDGNTGNNGNNGNRGKVPSIYGGNGYPLDSITPDGSKTTGSEGAGSSHHGHNHPVILLTDKSQIAMSMALQLPKYGHVSKLSKI